MKYKLFCKIRNEYYPENKEFETLEDVRDEILSFHMLDCGDPDTLNKCTLQELCEFADWEVRDDNGEKIKWT